MDVSRYARSRAEAELELELVAMRLERPQVTARVRTPRIREQPNNQLSQLAARADVCVGVLTSAAFFQDAAGSVVDALGCLLRSVHPGTWGSGLGLK